MKARFFKDHNLHSTYFSFMSYCLNGYKIFKKNRPFYAICFLLLALYLKNLSQKKLQPKDPSLDYNAWKNTIANKSLPLALVDLEAFDQNITTLSRMAEKTGKKIRLATKSIRIPALIRRALDSSTSFRGLMCYSIREAFFLHRNGFDDLLIAYPSLQHHDLYLLGKMLERGAEIMMTVDDIQQITVIANIMQKFSRPLPLVIDFDTSYRLGDLHLGVRRSPVRTLKDLEKILIASKQYPSIQIIGVMAYEAIVAGLPDQNPYTSLQNPLAYLIRRYTIQKIAKLRQQIPDVFATLNMPLKIFNGGGTGSMNFTVQESVLTEVTFGSGLLCPHIFDYYSNLKLKPAAFFALEATRRSDPQYITCLGGGYIASGTPALDRLPRPVMPEGLTLLSTEGAGEVQTPLKTSNRTPLALGSPIFFRHAKAGELAEHFNQVLLVTKDKSTYPVKTYRGLQQCFL